MSKSIFDYGSEHVGERRYSQSQVDALQKAAAVNGAMQMREEMEMAAAHGEGFLNTEEIRKFPLPLAFDGHLTEQTVNAAAAMRQVTIDAAVRWLNMNHSNPLEARPSLVMELEHNAPLPAPLPEWVAEQRRLAALEEAKWWRGFHKYGNPCGDSTCARCQRIETLSQRAGRP